MPDINKKIIFFLLFAAFLFFYSSAYSGESGPDSVGGASSGPVLLNSLIDQALKNNPQIQAAKFRYEAARSRVRLLRTLGDPKFEYEYDKITADMAAVMEGKTSPMRTFSISQEFPFPTKLFLRKQAAEKEANSYAQEYKDTQQKVIKDVKEAYFQLFLNNKKIILTQENLELLNHIIEITNTKYAANLASQQDVLKAQVEYSKLSNQLVLLEQEKGIFQAMLNSLLNYPQDKIFGELEEKNSKGLKFEQDKILQLAKDARPELLSFKEMVRKSEIDLALAKQEYLPDFMIKYKREQKDGKAGSWAGMLGMTIPLWFWDKQDSFVKEAKAQVNQVKAEYQAAENMVLFEVRASYVKFESAKKLVEIYETGVLPQAQAAFDTARLGYQSEKTEFLDLLDSLRTLKEFQMEYFESLADLEISLADLERSVGADLLIAQ